MELQPEDCTPPLAALPPELLIHIFSYLDIHSILSVQYVSKRFDGLFRDPVNERVIWRNACIIHGLVGFSPSRSDSETPPSRSLSSAGEVQANVGTGAGSEPPRREWGRWKEWVEKASEGRKGEAMDVIWSDVFNLHSSQSLQGLSMANVDWKGFCEHSLLTSQSTSFH